MTPLVHLNGTSPYTLLSVREDVYYALNTALDLTKQMAPNGRDYYPIGPDALEKAIEVHARRQKVLSDLMNEIAAEMAEISEQGGTP